MVYICYIEYRGSMGTCVLAVRDDELSMEDNGDNDTHNTASRLRVSGQAGTARAKTICNTNFYGHICVLLVKTNSMIYNMLYKK